MKNIIQFTVEKGEDGYYVASAVGHFIVTQAKTLDDIPNNIKEATELYLEGENLMDMGFASSPSLLANFEIPRTAYAL